MLQIEVRTKYKFYELNYRTIIQKVLQCLKKTNQIRQTN